MGTDQSAVDRDGGDDTESAETNGEENLEWSRFNWYIIGTFVVLTLVGVGLSVGALESVVTIPEEGSASGLLVIPLYVYLYAGFGALGYIFTKLIVQIDQYDEWSERKHLVKMAMRIPAAWILAAGVYLFLGEVGQTGSTTGARFAAGVAFLTGLYVNVAHKALGSLADRILGRTSQESE